MGFLLGQNGDKEALLCLSVRGSRLLDEQVLGWHVPPSRLERLGVEQLDLGAELEEEQGAEQTNKHWNSG